VPQPELNFVPSPDGALLLNTLLDRLERREAGPHLISEASPVRTSKVGLSELGLPGYYSQVDPEPRQVLNEQLQALEKAGLLHLFWQAGEKGHLLEAVALVPGQEASLYHLIGRIPTTRLRTRLESHLLGDRFRFNESDWRYRAVQHTLLQLKAKKSPAPFSLKDQVFNEDLLTGLVAIGQLKEETPFRVFSVRTFNDSKRFEDLKRAIIRLTRLGQPEWKHIPETDLLSELNLVANPTYLLFAGPWKLVDVDGQELSLGGFNPSVAVSAVQAAHVQRVRVHASQVLCVENLTTFHTLANSLARDPLLQRTALMCLAGNPSPACRWLLSRLSLYTPEDIPLYIWADLDYGGFNILSQLRREVNTRFLPYQMDAATLERFAQFARPLTLTDQRNLARQLIHPELEDMHPVIAYLLKRGLKLEQEAIDIGNQNRIYDRQTNL
jgi:hypothetical protein